MIRAAAATLMTVFLGWLSMGCAALSEPVGRSAIPKAPIVVKETESNSYEKIGEAERIWLVRNVEKSLIYSNGQQVKENHQELLLCVDKGGALPQCKPVRIVCGDGTGKCHSHADMMNK